MPRDAHVTYLLFQQLDMSAERNDISLNTGIEMEYENKLFFYPVVKFLEKK